jgi:hypothetical protein
MGEPIDGQLPLPLGELVLFPVAARRRPRRRCSGRTCPVLADTEQALRDALTLLPPAQLAVFELRRRRCSSARI